MPGKPTRSTVQAMLYNGHLRAQRRPQPTPGLGKVDHWLSVPLGQLDGLHRSAPQSLPHEIEGRPVPIPDVLFGPLDAVRGRALLQPVLGGDRSSARRSLGHLPPCGIPRWIAQSGEARSAPVWLPKTISSGSLFIRVWHVPVGLRCGYVSWKPYIGRPGDVQGSAS